MENNVEENNCCLSGKKKQRTPEEMKKLINRLSRIEGQIRGIKGMVEGEAYCTDILIQSSAVLSAIKAFNRELLEAHIKSCVADGIREGRDEVIDELGNILRRLM